jgi:hypothetical protein
MTVLLLVVFILCVIVSIYFASVINMSTAAVFYFDCLYKKFKEIGFDARNSKLIFNDIFSII